jgi:hypothetical protein
MRVQQQIGRPSRLQTVEEIGRLLRMMRVRHMRCRTAFVSGGAGQLAILAESPVGVSHHRIDTSKSGVPS